MRTRPPAKGSTRDSRDVIIEMANLPQAAIRVCHGDDNKQRSTFSEEYSNYKLNSFYCLLADKAYTSREKGELKYDFQSLLSSLNIKKTGFSMRQRWSADETVYKVA